MHLQDCKRQLEAKGYRVHQGNEWHLEVKKKGSQIVVAVWPHKNKVLKKYSPGPAPVVRNLIQYIEDQFLPIKLEPVYVSLEKQVAIELVQYWRENWQEILYNPESQKEYFELLHG